MDTLVEYLQSEFADLTPEELHLLASGMQERTVEQYQSLFRRGEDSESFAVIKSGRVGLLDSDGRTMVTLTAGNVLGARDFFTNAPAQMTARAESPPVTFWEMTAETFADLLEVQPRLGVHFAHSLGNTDSSTRLTEHLRRRLHRLPAFSGLGTDVLTMVAAALSPMELQLGDTLYRSGEQPSGLYLAVEGSLSRMTDSQPPTLIEDGALLGGENLASDIPYNHTVLAEESTLCWELSRNDFHRINQVHPVLQRALNRPAIPTRPDTVDTPMPTADDFSLSSVRELAALPDHILKAVSQVVTTRAVSAGQVVYQPGEPSSEFYVVYSGEIELSSPSDIGVNQELSRAAVQDVFGLDSLQAQTPRTKQATATVDTELLVLPRIYLLRLAEQFPEINTLLAPDTDSHSSKPAEESPTPAPGLRAESDLGDLHGFSVFWGLTGQELARIQTELQPVVFYPQEQLFTRGDTVTALYLLQEGKVLLEDEDGQIRYLEPTSAIGLDSLLSQAPVTEHAFASTEIRVVLIPRERVWQLATEIPRFDENLRSLAQQETSAPPVPVVQQQPATPPPTWPAAAGSPPAQPSPTIPSGPATGPSLAEPPSGLPPAHSPQSTSQPAEPVNPFGPPPAGTPPLSAPGSAPVVEQDPFLADSQSRTRDDQGFGGMSVAGKVRAILTAVLVVYLVGWAAFSLIQDLIPGLV